MFDLTITLGNVLTMATMAVAGFCFVWTMKGDLQVFGSRLDKLEKVMDKVTDALVQLARQEVRLDSHAERISRLEREDNS